MGKWNLILEGLRRMGGDLLLFHLLVSEVECFTELEEQSWELLSILLRSTLPIPSLSCALNCLLSKLCAIIISPHNHNTHPIKI